MRPSGISVRAWACPVMRSAADAGRAGACPLPSRADDCRDGVREAAQEAACTGTQVGLRGLVGSHDQGLEAAAAVAIARGEASAAAAVRLAGNASLVSTGGAEWG